MIRCMLMDIKVFLTLMVLFMIAQGVLLNSFTNPNSEYEGFLVMFWDILFMPYYQIYGELFLENIVNDQIEIRTAEDYTNFCLEDDECCFRNKRKADLKDLNSKLNETYFNSEHTFEDLHFCGIRNDRMTVILTAVYMMLANVIMLNILIAIFNFRYEQVQAASNKISAFMR